MCIGFDWHVWGYIYLTLNGVYFIENVHEWRSKKSTQCSCGGHWLWWWSWFRSGRRNWWGLGIPFAWSRGMLEAAKALFRMVRLFVMVTIMLIQLNIFFNFFCLLDHHKTLKAVIIFYIGFCSICYTGLIIGFKKFIGIMINFSLPLCCISSSFYPYINCPHLFGST